MPLSREVEIITVRLPRCGFLSQALGSGSLSKVAVWRLGSPLTSVNREWIAVPVRTMSVLGRKKHSACLWEVRLSFLKSSLLGWV